MKMKALHSEQLNTVIRSLFGALIAVGCYLVFRPFLSALAMAAVVCIISWPMFRCLRRILGKSSVAASIVMTTALVVLIVLPLSFGTAAIIHRLPAAFETAKTIATQWVQDGDLTVPEWVSGLPTVGPWLHDLLTQMVSDTASLLPTLKALADPATKIALAGTTMVWDAGVQILLVTIILFFFWSAGDGLERISRKVIAFAGGQIGHELGGIIVSTTRSVVWGIGLTAIGQGLVAWPGFLIADVPYAGLLSIAVSLVSVIPCGPFFVWGPAAIWLFSTGHLGMAAFLVLWGLLAVSSVDNFLKPVVIARGTPLPMGLVFLGVFGGVIAFGFLGIILGPVLLALGVAMARAWFFNKPDSLLVGASDGSAAKPGEDEGENENRDEAPQASAPKSPVPEGAVPEVEVPVPEVSVPQGRVPEVAAPKGGAPEDNVPTLKP